MNGINSRQSCTDEEEKSIMRSINHKPIWKDRSHKTADTMSNGVCIQPFRTLSSYNLWMRRNVLLFSSSDDYAYISGSNLVIESNAKGQRIIQLKPDCKVTSLSYQFTSTKERLIIVGERVNPDESNKFHSGRVEIINLDCTLLPERIVLDHSIYAVSESFIFDALIPENSEYCYSLLKKDLEDNSSTKLFIWSFANKTLLNVEEFKLNIDGLVRNPINPSSFVLFNMFYVAIWEYFESKKKMLLSLEVYNKNSEEITDVEFIQDKRLNGIIIGFRSNWFEVIKLSEDPKNSTKPSAEIYLRIDLFSIFDKNWVEMQEIDPERSEKKREAMTITDNFIPLDSLTFTPNFGLDKPTVHEVSNFVKYIISRDKYILIFLENSPVITILELVDSDETIKVKISSIDMIEHPIKTKASLCINSKLTKMILVLGEIQMQFYHLMNAKRMELSRYSKGGGNDYFGQKNNRFSLEEIKISYFRYKINFVENSPNFVFQGELLKDTANGFPMSRILLSETPRMLFLNNGTDEKDVFIYKQSLNSTDKPMSFQNNYESNTENFVHSQTEFYKDQIDFELFLHKKLADKPNCIAFSPQSRTFFVSYKEGGYFYSIIGSEVKELIKVSLYCKACAFSETGAYFALATSEFENEYTIHVLNMATLSCEFIIEKLPCPIKIQFHHRDQIISTFFNDNSINLIVLHLNWNHRHLKTTAFPSKEKNENDEQAILIKITDFSGNINDYAYDYHLDHCIITSADKRVRVYNGYREEKHWEFFTDIEYNNVLLLKRLDAILFGTPLGSIRCMLWPIANISKESSISHPDYSELFIHSARITAMTVSNDYRFLYTGSIDGSIFVSCIYAISQDVPITLQSFIYFNPQHMLPKKMHFEYTDIVTVTDSLYQGKIDALKRIKLLIQSRISEFTANKEKLIQSNNNEIESKRTELTDFLEQNVRMVKEKGNEKEKETKKMKDERELYIQFNKDELRRLKNTFKEQKETKQVETTKLIASIKAAKEKFNQRIVELDTMRSQTNGKIESCLENLHQILREKKEEIGKMIIEKEHRFKEECEKNEDKNETDIREKEKQFKTMKNDYETKIKDNDNEIMRKNKDNKNYKEKISEWDNHLKELKINNDELMETFLMNKLKLYQMNQLLSDNESKISAKEKIVKDKRLVNDRLEQLRFVLEYQIKNLFMEKTPIEEQIKNFESLHSDFYKRFNLLYAESLSISELIENNQKCIKTYRNELTDTKTKLYQLKNLYKCIEIKMNNILKSKLETKKSILQQIYDVHKTYLANFSDGKKKNKGVSDKMKLQTKNIENEIYYQKNNVLKELKDKRIERQKINIQKDDMMKDIRLDNQLLIQECSNIRENLEDILKNINDIEKKFLELTSNNAFLIEDNTVKDIKGKIRQAKDFILLHDEDKTRLMKENIANSSKPQYKEEPNVNIDSGRVLSPEDLIRRQQMNTVEIRHQQEELEKMQKKLKELVSDNNASANKKLNDDKLGENIDKVFKRRLSNASKPGKGKGAVLAHSKSVLIKGKRFNESNMK